MPANSIQKIELKSKILEDVTSLFEEFLEAEQELFDRNIHGFFYWHYIRFAIINEIFAARGWIERINMGRQASLFTKIGLGAGLLKNSILHSIHRDHFHTDILFLNSPSRVLRNGQFIDPFTEPLLTDLAYSYSLWEVPLIWRHKKHSKNRRLFYLDSLLLKTLIHRTFIQLHLEATKKETTCIYDFIRKFKVELSISDISTILSYAVSLHVCCSEVIKNKLLQKKVKLLILVNHYDPLKMLITSIAKSLGIYVVELQHGNMGRYHIAYNFKRTEALNALPHEIFTFGKFWNDTTRITQNQVRLTAVGMPYFEGKIRSVSVNQKQARTQILFLSQDTIARQLSDIAIKLSRRLDSKKYEIIYKMHPREYHNWKKNYPKEFRTSNIRVVTSEDLYELLNQTDIHIGVYSTAIIESLAFNKKLILLESYGIQFLFDLIKKGRAIFARDFEDVLNAILSPKYQNEPSEDLTYFWEANSREKIIHRIHELLV